MQNREIGDELRAQAVRKRHDDREDHRRRANNGGSDQHRLCGCFECVPRAVVLLEQMLRSRELRIETVLAP